MTNQMQLRHQEDEGGTRYLSASLDPNGDLKIEGQDLGKAVEMAFGTAEYEYAFTIKADDVPALLTVLGVEEDVLAALKQYYKDPKAMGPQALLDTHSIKYEFWSWNS